MSASKELKMEKLTPKDGETTNLVQENINGLKQLFPEVFIDGRIDFEALKQTLGSYVEDGEERYSFTWHGKSRARRIAQTPSNGTLLPCKEESVNWDSTQNIFIEGDNLEVLKLLQKSYHRKVKMIYIDPPYNTGKEFIYPDKWQDNLDTYLRYTGQIDDEGFKTTSNTESSGRYHTNWLNMMYPRLKLARNLLRDDGVIFVSIDDHEVHNLRILMDEIFGAENFVDTVIWQKIFTVKNSARYLSSMHDYVIVYARNKVDWSPGLLPRSEELDATYTNPDDDPRGPWTTNAVQARNFYGQGLYEIVSPSGQVFTPPTGTYWRVSRETFDQLDRDRRIWWGKDGTSTPRIKKFLSEAKQGIVPSTLWLHDEVGTNAEAKKELLARVDFSSPESVFDTPKPTRLIQRMLQIGTDAAGGEIVLDFFAGSGSTAEAIVGLDSANGTTTRRYILVQLPERTGASDYPCISDITRTRLKSNGESGFRAFRLSSSNIKPWDSDFQDIEASLFDAIENIKPERSEHDVLYELILKYGLDLAVPVEERTLMERTVFVIGAGALIVCLASDINLDAVRGIADLIAELAPETCRVVFKDTGFANDVVKTNAVQILKQAGVDDVKSL